MIVLVAALVAGVIGNIAQRQIYGPTAAERADQAKIAAAAKARDQAAYDRATKEAAVDNGPREFLWTVIPISSGGITVHRNSRGPMSTAASFVARS